MLKGFDLTGTSDCANTGNASYMNTDQVFTLKVASNVSILPLYFIEMRVQGQFQVTSRSSTFNL